MIEYELVSAIFYITSHWNLTVCSSCVNFVAFLNFGCVLELEKNKCCQVLIIFCARNKLRGNIISF